MLRDRFDPRYFERDVLFRYHAGWAGLTHSRSSPATYFDRTGVLREAAANVPRVDWSHGRPALRLEAQRTNQIRNPRCEGAVVGVVGSGGALPTHWGVDTDGGLAWEVVGTGVEDGLPYVAVRAHGTPTGTISQIRCEAYGQIAAAAGQTWTGSAYARIAGGSLDGIGSARIALQERTGSTFLGQTMTPITLSATRLSAGRVAATRTLSHAETTDVLLTVGLSSLTVGVPVDITLRIAGPQMEPSPVASSLVLPPVGAPAASVRTVDRLSHPLAGLRSCAVYARGEERGNVMLSGFPRLWQWGGGVAGNVRVVCNAGTYGITLSPTSGGSVSRSLTTAPAVGQGFELIAQIELTDGAVRGRLIQSIEGGSVEDTGWSVPVPADFAPATLYVGARDGGNNAGLLAVRDLLVLDGADWTMDAARRYLPW